MAAKSVATVRAPMLALVAGLWAGLARLGFVLPASRAIAAEHGPLMISGFLGTLICLERAVALGTTWSYAAPGFAAAGTIVTILLGDTVAGAALFTLAAVILLFDFAILIPRDPQTYMIVMALGAASWLVGNAMLTAHVPIAALVWWWAGFLVLTIMGERLEMSRVLAPSVASRAVFISATALFVAALQISAVAPRIGLRLIGVAMIAFAVWIGIFDVARRTIRRPGLPRFGAVNLLAGAGWMVVAGAMRLGFSPAMGILHYDAILHAVFLGFVFSMIFAHAPIIFPAVIGRAMPFNASFYAHVIVLHASLVLRVAADLVDLPGLWRISGALNVAAILLFIVSTIRSVASGVRTARVHRSVHAPQVPLRSND